MPRSKKIFLKKFAFILIGVILAIFAVKSVVSYISAATGTVTEENAASFLEKCGWKIERSSAETEEVYIPAVFSEVYERYNAIQLKQGYDLSKYKGERVIKYSFTVTNYKGFDNVQAHVLTWGGKIIVGDICSTELNGFMTGFSGEE